MKSILFSILLLFLPKLAISQISKNDKLIYLDSTETETNNDNYKYLRIIKDAKLKKELYIVNDYYESGALKMKGATSKTDYLSKEGQFIYYYENKNKESISNYIKNSPNGKEYKWYENGNKKLEGEYIVLDEKTKKTELKINQFWNAKNIQTIVDGNGDYEEDNEGVTGSGKVKNGYKNGEWKGNDKKLKYTYTEFYEKGGIVSGISIDSNKVTHEYKVVEIRPELKKGIESFYKFVVKNFKIPDDPKFKGGKVYLGFTINLNGRLVNPKILKSLTPEVDKEALKLMGKFIASDFEWIVAEKRGIKYKYEYKLPITLYPSE